MNLQRQNNDQEIADRKAFIAWVKLHLDQLVYELNSVPPQAKESPWGKQHQFEIGFLSRSLERLKSETRNPQNE